jgi:hypothetical protein
MLGRVANVYCMLIMYVPITVLSCYCVSLYSIAVKWVPS